MKGRGFTLLELVVAVTIAGVVLGAAMLLMRDVMAEQRRAHASIVAAQDARRVAEELRKALRTYHWEDGTSLALAAGIGTPRFLLVKRGSDLFRVYESVDETRVAEHVEGVDRVGDGVVVRFARPVGASEPYRTSWTLRIPGSYP
jgi:prepilin-type N-terminal cleavage/methylation domain-containing protein